MKKLSEIQNQLGIKLLQRAASGVGKSHRALTIGLRYGSVLVLDFDGNVQRNLPSIEKQGKLASVFVEDFHRDGDAASFKDSAGIIDTSKRDEARVKRLYQFLTAELQKETLEYQTLVVDTTTSLSEMVFNSLKCHPIWGQRKETMGMYGELGEIMKKVLRDLATLPVNLIVNAHEEIDLQTGTYSIIGHGKSSNLWEKPFADKHRLLPGNKTLVPRVRAAQAEGLACGNVDLLDADGFLKPEHIYSLFDNIAIKSA